MSEEEASKKNLELFRDSLFSVVLQNANTETSKKKKRDRTVTKTQHRSIAEISTTNASPPDASQLAEFSDFLAGECFPSLPKDLRCISIQAMQENVVLSDKWSIPLSLGTYEEIAELIPPSVTDSLEAYGLIEPPKSDLQSFLSPAVAAYLQAATAAPPKWIETKVSSCEVCERDWVPMTYHHLIPKGVHTKVLKRGWHDEQALNSVAWLCRACHSFVHQMASNEELAKEYFTVERILAREDVQKWASWISKVRWKKR